MFEHLLAIILIPLTGIMGLFALGSVIIIISRDLIPFRVGIAGMPGRSPLMRLGITGLQPAIAVIIDQIVHAALAVLLGWIAYVCFRYGVIEPLLTLSTSVASG